MEMREELKRMQEAQAALLAAREAYLNALAKRDGMVRQAVSSGREPYEELGKICGISRASIAKIMAAGLPPEWRKGRGK